MTLVEDAEEDQYEEELDRLYTAVDASSDSSSSSDGGKKKKKEKGRSKSDDKADNLPGVSSFPSRSMMCS